MLNNLWLTVSQIIYLVSCNSSSSYNIYSILDFPNVSFLVKLHFICMCKICFLQKSLNITALQYEFVCHRKLIMHACNFSKFSRVNWKLWCILPRSSQYSVLHYNGETCFANSRQQCVECMHINTV